ncbi:MAG: AAA family ATPase [Deltaproteobacteria bacterium]|jgi:general secretion pathway protein A|nr:AAA family ATPase [Deltaproteobacteria bacterium]MBW2669902.1 AAA family ATPase [Deltaproteobacteria bacterium]
MYENFFGFKERPFKLVPNPAYLFLSKSHEEVLAHLAYAVIQGDGFMEITGEVGTGKTTLCRAFLENLDHNTKAAYIFNPNLNSVQLLKTINDEFDINSDADNTKDLIDTLNSFLIMQKTQGNNTILLIDEAQNLTKEVLEQLRLLSNLETAKHKLLHIILVGQPELKKTLNSFELRQLSQRISLSCQIIPLNYKEVTEYIEHRISIASQKPGVKFTRAAYRSIYKYSRGVPRLINIVCDRALLTAFGLDQQIIKENTIKASIRELTARGETQNFGLKKRRKIILFFSIFCLTLMIFIIYPPRFFNMNTIYNSPEIKKREVSRTDRIKTSVPDGPATDSGITRAPAVNASKSDPESIAEPVVKLATESVVEPVVKHSTKSVVEPVVKPAKKFVVKPVVKPATQSVVEPGGNLGNFLDKMNRFSSRHMAIKAALDLWNTGLEIKHNLDVIDDDHDFFRIAAEKNGLSIRRIVGNLNAVKKLNLPVVLTFYPSNKVSPVYLTLSKIDYGKITLRGGKEDISLDLTPTELEAHWSGVAYIPWKNFLSLKGTIPLDSPNESIITLKMLLRDIGFKNVEISPSYDDKTQLAIKKIQRKYGLHIDGAVGSTTKIALYNEKYFSELPHITTLNVRPVKH